MIAPNLSNTDYEDLPQEVNVAELTSSPAVVDTSSEIVMLHNMGLLDKLLADKTTGGNITWATNEYAERGPEYGADRQIHPELIMFPNTDIVQPRAAKSQAAQSKRTRTKGEVFTPVWVCPKMNEYIEAEATDSAKDWRQLIDFRMLEITCGEAPFLVSRYDSQTGKRIKLEDRVGLLDFKLRVVAIHSNTKQEWTDWAIRAYESTYGFEFQGDSLLIGRINMLMTFIEYYEERWSHPPDRTILRKLANVIAWNVWQMDGLTGRTPAATILAPIQRQISLFDTENDVHPEYKAAECRIYDWRSNHSLLWSQIGRGKNEI